MNVVPLHGPAAPGACDARREVWAPGGYQCWTFEAEDQSGGWQLSASFCEGFPLHPRYLRRVAAYLRAPTRLPPPAPADFACVAFTLYGHGRTVAQFICQSRREDCRLVADHLDVRIGASHFCRQADGSLHLRLRGTPWGITLLGPRPIDSQQVTAHLVFRAAFAHSCIEQVLAERGAGGESAGFEHRWMASDAFCQVQGTIHLYGHGGITESQAIPFTGCGSLERAFGTAPLHGAFRRYLRGRVMLDGRALFVHVMKPADVAAAETARLIAADASGIEVVPVVQDMHDWRGRGFFQVRYPSRIDLGPALRLSSPTVLASTPLSARVRYRAAAAGSTGTATCDVLSPHRAAHPVVGRLIELAIGEH